jgi:precorrin-6A/cobalt-precorrin-6A reductase
VLVLAGSSEASAIAARLHHGGRVDVVASFAGRVKALRLPPGRARVGGFGGPAGMAAWLEAERIDAVIDATHPFTARMPVHAAEACASAAVPRVRLLRPEWVPVPGDRWVTVPDLDAAAAAIADLGAARVFLTTGRKELGPFAGLTEVWFLVRSIDPPEDVPLARFELLLHRGPFEEGREEALLASHRIDALVTKNSGGSAAVAKLAAARRRGIPVVMVSRPPTPAGTVVTTEDGAIEWCASTGLGDLG